MILDICRGSAILSRSLDKLSGFVSKLLKFTVTLLLIVENKPCA